MDEKIDERFREGKIRFHCLNCKKYTPIYRDKISKQFLYCYYCNTLLGIDDEILDEQFFGTEIQKDKMKELWNNPEDEVFENG